MWKYIIGSVIGLVVAWIAFAALTGLDTEDVVVYNRLDHSLGTATFRAGDLVAISPDGQRTDLLCEMTVADDVLRDARIKKSYSNWLEESLPTFASAAAWTKEMIWGGATTESEVDTVGKRIDFSGRVVSLPAGEGQPVTGADCTCAIAKAKVQRHSVCMVSKSMNETVLVPQDPFDATRGWTTAERTVGASYRDHQVVIPDVQALQCPNIASGASIPEISQSCPAGARMNSVWVRNKLRVIREYDLQSPI